VLAGSAVGLTSASCNVLGPCEAGLFSAIFWRRVITSTTVTAIVDCLIVCAGAIYPARRVLVRSRAPRMAESFTCPKCGASIPGRSLESGEPAACPHCSQPSMSRPERDVDGSATANPYASPPPPPAQPGVSSPKELTAYQAYNIVSDIATGVNFRKKDNLYQAIAIFVGLVLGVLIGLAVARGAPEGAVLGGFIGLLVGLFGSGIFLLIYRLFKH